MCPLESSSLMVALYLAAVALLTTTNLITQPALASPNPNSVQTATSTSTSISTSATSTTSTSLANGSPNFVRGRYQTLYACEDRQLVMDCQHGFKINLIRANYGRFSVTQCNEQGQLDLAIDCMSPITFRVMRERCQDKQRCSVNATSAIFGDKCPKTRKYLEVHFQCQTDPKAQQQQITLISEPENRIDLRNINSQPTHVPLINYPQAINGIGGSILPPNNPSFNPMPSLPSQNSPSDAAIVNMQVTHTSPSNDDPAVSHTTTNPSQVLAVMNSQILNYTFLLDSKMNPTDPTRLDEPIIVTIRHQSIENVSNPRCFAWDPRANQWSVRGSQVIRSNLTHTTCAFDQPSYYMLVMDHTSPLQTISQTIPIQEPILPISTPIPIIFNSPPADILEKQPYLLPESSSPRLEQPMYNNQGVSSTITKSISIFGYLIASTLMAIAILTIAFVTSSMRSSAGAALKSLGNFSAFHGPKYGGRRADNNLHNKDLLVINNQNGHQFLYTPASTTKINSSASTHILSSGIPGQHHSTLHQIQQQQQQQQQQQMYSGNGTLSNLSNAGGQSNNYYYGLMGFNSLFQQQQREQQTHLQHHMSQHQLNQAQGQQQATLTPVSYHHQANKSTISTESANSSPSSSGVESGSTSMQAQQATLAQSSCLMTNSDFNHLGQVSNQSQSQNLFSMAGQQQQPSSSQPQQAITLNAHYSSSVAGGVGAGGLSANLVSNYGRINSNLNSSMREHIYECVDEDKSYPAHLMLATNLNPPSEQFSSNTLSQHQHHHQQMLYGQSQQLGAQANSRAMTLSSRMNMQHNHQQQLHHPQQQLQKQNQAQIGKSRMLLQPAIVRDNQAKTSIICSKAQVTPQRATEINKFQHDL